MRYLLIPSCGIEKQNQLCKTDTLLRLQEGLRLWRTGSFDYLLVSGGIFNPPEIQTVSASELMRDWLIEQGVPKGRIICESRSLDTYENISMSLDILREIGDQTVKITVVTQWQHAIRFRITFLLGYRMWIRTVSMHYPMAPQAIAKEFLFILHHLLFPKGEWSPWSKRIRTLRTPTETI